MPKLRRRFVQILLLFPWLLLAELAHAQSPATACGESCSCEHRSTVFILNGAGNFFGTTDNFQRIGKKLGHPIEVITFEWSHGRWRILADQTDQSWSISQGKKFAQVVLEHHQQNPGRPIHIVAHSAGVYVALVALEELPAGIVKHVVFMAPSVSAHYDLRPALRAVGCQLTNYYSCRDWFYIGVMTRFVGTADRIHAATAGHKAFRVSFGLEESGLAAKLVQRPWHFRDLLQGNNGTHYGAYQVRFLEREIVPLLMSGS